jgi:thymidine kinase
MFLEPADWSPGGGWIEVICGSMFSGKTEELIRRLRRAKIAGQDTIIFKPEIDDRYHESDIVSHDKSSIPSIPVTSSQQILLYSQDAKVVGIDEAQFFDAEIVEVVNDLANRGKRVILAGLDMDFMGRPFGPMPNLLATAEFVTKLHAICPRTGYLAHYSFRKDAGNSNKLLIGEKAEYEPLSRKMFVQEMKKRKEATKSLPSNPSRTKREV